MKGIIVYKGKYGATRQYAEWAAEKLGLPLFAPEEVDIKQLETCGFLAIGSSVYIGRMLISKWLKQHVSILQNKKLFLFVVCATPSSDKQAQEKIALHNIPDPLMSRCEIFFLPGRFIFNKLSWGDKLVMKLRANMEKDPVKRAGLLSDVDGVKNENLAPLVMAVKEFTRVEQMGS